jgi:hypothetical protein
VVVRSPKLYAGQLRGLAQTMARASAEIEDLLARCPRLGVETVRQRMRKIRGRQYLRALLGTHQKLTTSARIKLTTSKTPIATWHGTASVGSSPPPQAQKSFPGYARGRSHPRGAAARHETSLGADIAESGPDGWSTLQKPICKPLI